MSTIWCNICREFCEETRNDTSSSFVKSVGLNKFSKPFKSYLGEDAVYNFINSMVEESKFCTDIVKKHFN